MNGCLLACGDLSDPSSSNAVVPQYLAEFIESLLPKVEWAALKDGATCLNMEDDAAQLPGTAEEVSKCQWNV